MEKNRCCPTDTEMKLIWESELKRESDFLKNSNIQEIALLLKIISNPTRLQIIMHLLKKDYCVCELVYLLNEKQNLISYNLGLLKKHEIVESYNRSKDKYYKLGSNENALLLLNFINEKLIVK
ncbi:helix-turn-helix transcriptional regulator [Methanobacterium sp. SMA-27]|uniref:ArsR/SmtB family transcription factor n=1 Tax=Methanobacterium sp. SMA-27 TaxID=1495336 RepID=UPI000694BE8C|nr:winged helix-turn-helix domain-containing protein [Methanobacterium sp. SMA-27]